MRKNIILILTMSMFLISLVSAGIIYNVGTNLITLNNNGSLPPGGSYDGSVDEEKTPTDVSKTEEENIAIIFNGLIWFLVAILIFFIGFLTDILRKERKIKKTIQASIIIVISIVLITSGYLVTKFVEGESFTLLIWTIVGSIVVFILMLTFIVVDFSKTRNKRN